MFFAFLGDSSGGEAGAITIAINATIEHRTTAEIPAIPMANAKLRDILIAVRVGGFRLQRKALLTKDGIYGALLETLVVPSCRHGFHFRSVGGMP